MSAPKYINFYEQLANTVVGLDPQEVKSIIGDSTNNHRTLTVNQVVRFLINSDATRNVGLGRKLRSVYSLIRNDIKNSRVNSRTDAIDINEFLLFYTGAVIGMGDYRNNISKTV